MHLAEASELQAQQITQATSAIKDTAQAVDGMASDATESAAGKLFSRLNGTK